MRIALTLCLMMAARAAPAEEKPYGVDREFTLAEYASHNARMRKSDAFDTAPRLLKAYVPLYPASSVRSGKTGRCIVEYAIAVDGRTADVTPVEGDEIMCDHATLSVRQWRYAPATQRGAPVRLRVRVPIHYWFK